MFARPSTWPKIWLFQGNSFQPRIPIGLKETLLLVPSNQIRESSKKKKKQGGSSQCCLVMQPGQIRLFPPSGISFRTITNPPRPASSDNDQYPKFCCEDGATLTLETGASVVATVEGTKVLECDWVHFWGKTRVGRRHRSASPRRVPAAFNLPKGKHTQSVPGESTLTGQILPNYNNNLFVNHIHQHHLIHQCNVQTNNTTRIINNNKIIYDTILYQQYPWYYI